jgi:hypothetical protein
MYCLPKSVTALNDLETHFTMPRPLRGQCTRIVVHGNVGDERAVTVGRYVGTLFLVRFERGQANVRVAQSGSGQSANKALAMMERELGDLGVKIVKINPPSEQKLAA